MRFAIYWGIQVIVQTPQSQLWMILVFCKAMWVIFSMLPALILLGKKLKEQPKEYTWRDRSGCG